MERKETASGDADRWRLGQSLGDASAQIHAEWLVADARQQIDGLQRNQAEASSMSAATMALRSWSPSWRACEEELMTRTSRLR